MKKSKTVLVTIIVAVMFAVIYGGLFLLYKPGFTILTVLLTVYGFMRSTSDFHGWLNEDAPLKPATPTNKQVDRTRRSEQNRRPFFDIELEEPTGSTVRR